MQNDQKRSCYMLPPLDSVCRELMKMLSINEAHEEVTCVGCKIKGRKPKEQRKSYKSEIHDKNQILEGLG